MLIKLLATTKETYIENKKKMEGRDSGRERERDRERDRERGGG